MRKDVACGMLPHACCACNCKEACHTASLVLPLKVFASHHWRALYDDLVASYTAGRPAVLKGQYQVTGFIAQKCVGVRTRGTTALPARTPANCFVMRIFSFLCVQSCCALSLALLCCLNCSFLLRLTVCLAQ